MSFCKDTFCMVPWSTLQINPDGNYKICAFTGVGGGGDHGLAFDENHKPMNVLTHSIKEALNSKYHKSIRLSQSKNERNPLCRVCWDRDDANIGNEKSNSMRVNRTFHQLVDMPNAITLQKAPDFFLDEGHIDEMPISLDLRFTNVCNMKCIMCNSLYSKLWIEDEKKLYGKRILNLADETSSWHDSPIWWQRFEEIQDRVKHIYLTGGEPFLVKGHDELLDRLIASGNAPTVTLEYDTNLTIINDKILIKLKQFKNIVLSVSCDDIEDKFELIRFPGDFKVMLKHLEILRDRGIKIRHLSSCVGIYSLFSPIRVYDYFSPMGYDTYSFRFLRAPDKVDIAYLPNDIKDVVIERYNKSNLPDKWKNYMSGYLNKYKGIPQQKINFQMNQFVTYMNDLDTIRGTNWKNTFPEVVDLIHNYI